MRFYGKRSAFADEIGRRDVGAIHQPISADEVESLNIWLVLLVLDVTLSQSNVAADDCEEASSMAMFFAAQIAPLLIWFKRVNDVVTNPYLVGPQSQQR